VELFHRTERRCFAVVVQEDVVARRRQVLYYRTDDVMGDGHGRFGKEM
jgi:hypothetical protein